MNFEEIWERVREKTGMENLYELAEFIGKKRQFVSKKKKLNQFETDWAFKIAQEYGISTDWIMTGKHPEITNRNTSNQRCNYSYLMKVETWLINLIKKDPRNRDWFERQFEEAFPQFEKWSRAEEVEEKEKELFGEEVYETVN